MITAANLNDNLAYLSLVSQWDPATLKKVENYNNIIRVAQEIIEQLNSSEISTLDQIRLQNIAHRIQNKTANQKRGDPLKKIWDLCYDINMEIKNHLGLSPAEIAEYLNSFSKSSFQKFYCTFENRKCIQEFIKLIKLDNSYQEVIAQIEQWIGELEHSLSQKDLLSLISDLDVTDKSCHSQLSLKDLLKCHGFSPNISSIKFSSPEIVKRNWGVGESGSILNFIDFTDITFNNCNFQWVNLSGCTFKNTKFHNCDLSFIHIKRSAKFIDTRFENCQLKRSFLNKSSLSNCILEKCDLQYASLHASEFNSVSLRDCKLKGTSFQDSTFIDACKVSSKEPLKDCFLPNNNVNLDLTDSIILPSDKCKVGFWWNVDSPRSTSKKAETSIIKSQCIPLKGDDNPDEVNPTLLKGEVQSILSTFKPNLLSRPIIQELIHVVRESDLQQYPQLKMLMNSAKVMIKNVDCLLIPGGSDIEAEFYDFDAHTHQPNYKRTLLEFFSVYFARERGLPIVGICRGMQLLGIYHGAELIKHIPGQLGKIQRYFPTPTTNNLGLGLIRPFMYYPVRAYSLHHQALMPQTLSKDLEVISIRKDIVKAAEGTKGAPMVLFQWHPEIQSDPDGWWEKILFTLGLFSSSNAEMLNTFYNIGKVTQSKKRMLKALVSNR